MRNQLNGIVVIDKPAGISSARTVAEVKRIVGAAKVGHTGTLDPFATGVLICCLNQATRLAQFFLKGGKRYEAVLRLGTVTDTQDATGRVIERHPVPPLLETELISVFKRFEGRQMQQPPVYAALKHQGVPLYKLARQGKPVSKAPRPVTISDLQVLTVALPDVHFHMHCTAGTYVRSLCADIGKAIGCGGHLAQLRRTDSSGFRIAEAVSMDRLKDLAREKAWHSVVVPMADALRGMPIFKADAELLKRIAQGRPLTCGQIPHADIQNIGDPPRTGYVKIVDASETLKAVLCRAPGRDVYNYCCVFN